jgi:hypothetical protein
MTMAEETAAILREANVSCVSPAGGHPATWDSFKPTFALILNCRSSTEGRTGQLRACKE